ncbi:MAG: ISKra4 family transposase [Streptosporangiaceae bacterium]
MVSVLADPGNGRLTHAEMEVRLTGLSRELVRQLHQDSLDLRALREERLEPVTGSDGVRRGIVEPDHDRGLATIFGQVTVNRLAYRHRGDANLYPADAILSLPEDKYSHGLARLTAIEAPRGSFGQAGEAITRATGVRIGKRQVERLTVAAAADVDAFYAAHRAAPAGSDVLLVMQFDGKGIVMRREALREATAKAAAGATRKLATRLSPGEKNGRKRMAELGCVHDCEPVPRTAADIITRPGKSPPETAPRGKAPARKGPVASGKWLTASVTDDIPAVIAAGFAEADRRDPARERAWIALVDGNKQQIEAIEAEAGRRRGAEVTILIDLVHVLEYLWGAAWSFFETGDPAAEEWVAGQATKILESKSAQVAAGIRRRATTYGYSAKEREGADKCASYLTAKKPYLDYATALAGGWPIATGIIEGACRHIVKDRMDITGARWGLDSAEAVLKLRAIHSNGDFEAYWEWHLQQEQQRVHYSRYQLS